MSCYQIRIPYRRQNLLNPRSSISETITSTTTPYGETVFIVSRHFLSLSCNLLRILLSSCFPPHAHLSGSLIHVYDRVCRLHSTMRVLYHPHSAFFGRREIWRGGGRRKECIPHPSPAYIICHRRSTVSDVFKHLLFSFPLLRIENSHIHIRP